MKWLPTVNLSESGYRSAWTGAEWDAETLIRAAKEQGCEPFDYPLGFVDLTMACMFPIDPFCLDDFAHHLKRCMQTDLEHPIILGPLGNILDGFHRLAKAVALDMDVIKAVRLREMPNPDKPGREE